MNTALPLHAAYNKGKARQWSNQAEQKLETYAENDDAPQNGFLFIGELAKLTGTDPKTIRFYERAELISPPRHGRFRTYLASDVRRLKNVLTLRRLGVPIAQIRDILAMLSPTKMCWPARRPSICSASISIRCGTAQAEITQQIEKTSSALHSTCRLNRRTSASDDAGRGSFDRGRSCVFLRPVTACAVEADGIDGATLAPARLGKDRRNVRDEGLLDDAVPQHHVACLLRRSERPRGRPATPE